MPACSSISFIVWVTVPVFELFAKTVAISNVRITPIPLATSSSTSEKPCWLRPTEDR